MRRLILRPGAIGDCLLALPAIEHLAASYTEVWISSAVVPLIRFADRVKPLSSTGVDLVGIDDLEPSPELFAYLQSFDSIVSWYGAARAEFRRALEATGVACQFLPALPPADYAGHATTFFTVQVGAPDGIPRVDITPACDSPAIIVHPFSGSAKKNWPLANYRELAAKLPVKVGWSAGPEEQLAEARRFPSLAELASWLAGAGLYIGNDSGITHLAAAVGVPTLALFGPTDPAKWAPRGPNVTVLRSDPLEALRVETVLETANRLLG